MKIRTLAVALGLTLAVVPSASAATVTSWDGGARILTLTNDGDGERFTVDFGYTPGPPSAGYQYRVTATNANIPLGGSPCETLDGGKTIFCDPADNVSQVRVLGGEGEDQVTIAGSSYYTSSSPGLEVDGGNGNDTFRTGPKGAIRGDRVQGGSGDDTFFGSDEESDMFYAEAGNDTYRGGTRPVPDGVDPEGFQRNMASDAWRPVGASPITVSLDGQPNDVDGQGGTDNVLDVESIDGTPGDDTLTAGAASARFEGGGGKDTLTGSPEGDDLYGGAGEDTIRGLGGDDYLSDGDYDPIYRIAGDPVAPVFDDVLDAGDGNDTFEVGAGKDDVVGGAGTDHVSTVRHVTKTFEGSPPDDFRPEEAPVTISLDDQPNDGVTGSDEGDNVHADVEDVTVGSGGMGWAVFRSSRIIAIGGPPIPANDSVTGSAAVNVISTGGGNDTIDPGAGADTVRAGRGDDQVNAVDKATDVIACGRGADAVGADLEGSNAPRADALTECETVTGTPLGLEGGALPTAPAVTLAGARTVKVKTFLRTYTVATDVTTDQPASVAGELSVAGAKIAKVGALPIGSGRLASGTGTRKLRTKVAVRYRKALKRKLRSRKQRRRGIKLTLSVTTTNAAKQTTTTRRTIKIKG